MSRLSDRKRNQERKYDVSVRVMSWVWEQNLSTSKKMLLLAIADHSDDDGDNAWPAKPLLARKCNVSENRVRVMLRELEADNWISTKRNQGGTTRMSNHRRPNLYKINIERGLANEPPRDLADEAPRDLADEAQIISSTSGTSFVNVKRKIGKPDTIFDALMNVCDLDISILTTSARGAVNRAVKELREVNATPVTITKAANAYRKKFPDAAISPSALAKHYPSLFTSEIGRETPSRLRIETCTTCQSTGWVESQDFETTGIATVERCPDCKDSNEQKIDEIK